MNKPMFKQEPNPMCIPTIKEMPNKRDREGNSGHTSNNGATARHSFNLVRREASSALALPNSM